MLQEENCLSLLDIQTPDPIAERMLQIAEIVPYEDVVYDIGCGDGQIPIIAVREPFYARKGVGIEINPNLSYEAFLNVNFKGVQNMVEILEKDVFECDLSEADVVCLYSIPSKNEKLRPKLEEELKTSTRVVCHDFPIHKWKPSFVENFLLKGEKNYTRFKLPHSIYLYEMVDIYQK
jgi:SAM-dependent methyltransferase